MSKNIYKISELYFNYDWEKGSTLEFISNLGMVLTQTTIKVGNKGI